MGFHFKALIALYLFFLFPLIGSANKDSLRYYLQQGMNLYNTSNYTQAEASILKALQFSANDSIQQITLFNNLGNINAQLRNIEDAIAYYQRGLAIAEQLKDKVKEAEIIKNLAALYAEQKDFEKSLELISVAERTIDGNLHSILLADIKNNKAIIYEQQDKIDEAEKLYIEALALYKKADNIERLALTYNNLGVLNKNKKYYSRAIYYLEQSLELSKELNSQFFIAANLINLSNVYGLNNERQKAVDYAKKGVEISREIKDLDLVAEALESLSSHYAGMKLFQKAYEINQEYLEVYRNVINESRSKAITEMQEKYETLQKEKLIGSLQQEKELQRLEIEKQENQLKLTKIIVGLSLITILLMALSIIIYLKVKNERQRRKEQELVYNTEKKERLKLASDMHDELGSGLSKITLISQLIQKKEFEKPELLKMMNSLQDTSLKISDNMRSLVWSLNPEHQSASAFLARLKEFLGNTLEGIGFDFNFTISGNTNNLQLNMDVVKHLLPACKEAINNIIKHAKATMIECTVELTTESMKVSIIDNGIGITERKTGGHGLDSLQKRISECGGTLQINSAIGKGTEICFMNIPVTLIKNTDEAKPSYS
jgi:signal transduction histidine kinase